VTQLEDLKMQKSSVLEHFGTVTATAKALGISHVAVSKWDEIIPQGRAYQIEVLTGGKLKACALNTPQQPTPCV
jgi:transcriptional repressor of cell division inhibition gene dicB